MGLLTCSVTVRNTTAKGEYFAEKKKRENDTENDNAWHPEKLVSAVLCFPSLRLYDVDFFSHLLLLGAPLSRFRASEKENEHTLVTEQLQFVYLFSLLSLLTYYYVYYCLLFFFTCFSSLFCLSVLRPGKRSEEQTHCSQRGFAYHC